MIIFINIVNRWWQCHGSDWDFDGCDGEGENGKRTGFFEKN